MRRAVLALCLLAAPWLAAAQQLTVSAAASLGDAFKLIARQFEAAHPGLAVRLNLGASGALLQQIAQGAPADVLAAADEATVARGIAAGWLDPGGRRDFAGNVLVLVVPVVADGAATLRSLDDLASAQVKRIAIGKPVTVSAGAYAQAALDAAGLAARVAPKLVQTDSVRQALDYVARAEVDAGFVYRTDALLMADRVRVVEPLATPPIRYPAAVVAGSSQLALAHEFVAYLTTPAAQRVLAKLGFTPP
jgi:molybdate transport system substrate-binding protein